MALLLSYNQQIAIKKFSVNNAARYDQIAAEVEENELRSLLGTAFLQDVQDHPTTDANLALLNGGTYTDAQDNTIRFHGLRYILAYLNYSRYIGESFVADTFTGMVRKTHQDAEALSEGSVKRLQAENRAIAMTEWELTRAYIVENVALFPYWGDYSTRKPFTPRVWGVRKTYN